MAARRRAQVLLSESAFPVEPRGGSDLVLTGTRAAGVDPEPQFSSVQAPCRSAVGQQTKSVVNSWGY